MWLILWLLALVLGLAWRARNLAAFGPTNDEGAHLMWSQLTLEGYPLYVETQAVQAPLFLEWVGLALRLGGPNVAAGRWSTLVGYGALAAALSWLAYRDRGQWSALAAVLLLSLAPIIFRFSRLVMAEIPATALAVISLALLVRSFDSDRSERNVWLVASGLALGVSMLVKALNPFVALLAVGMLVCCSTVLRNGARRWRTLFFNSLWWGSGVFIPLLVVLLRYDPVAMVDQVVAFRGALRAAVPGSWAETWEQFSLMVNAHWGFWLLALGSVVSFSVRHYTGRVTRQREDKDFNFNSPPCPCRAAALFYPLTWLIWLLLGLAMLAWHTPLFAHHMIVLFPPLILLGAGFIADVVALWQQAGAKFAGLGSAWPRQPIVYVVGPAVSLTLLLIVAAFNLPAVIAANQAEAAIVTGGRETEAFELLQAVTAPSDFLMGDSQLLIYMAGRRTPPPLGDVALVAIKAGRQSSPRMVALSQAYQAAAVVQWSLRLPWLPDYLAWVEANYLARRVWDGDHLIYFAPRIPAEQVVPNAQAVRLGEAITLRGFELNPTSVKAGQVLNLRVYWQTEMPLTEDYTVFTQLLDRRGMLVAGWDSQPLGSYFPTSRWPTGEIVTDRVQLPLPSDLPADDYTLITGLYPLTTLERLTTPNGSDHILLTTISVVD